jgi:hypothetical protein
MATVAATISLDPASIDSLLEAAVAGAATEQPAIAGNQIDQDAKVIGAVKAQKDREAKQALSLAQADPLAVGKQFAPAGLKKSGLKKISSRITSRGRLR